MSGAITQLVYSISGLKTWNTHDGGGYQGNLLCNGKVVGWFHNDGNGGCTMIDFLKKEKKQTVRDREAERQFNSFIETLPEREWPKEWVKPGDPSTYKPSADMFIAELVEDFETRKRLKRLCTKKTLFLLKGEDPKEGWRTVNHPWCEKVKEYLHKNYGDKLGTIANEMLAAEGR